MHQPIHLRGVLTDEEGFEAGDDIADADAPIGFADACDAFVGQNFHQHPREVALHDTRPHIGDFHRRHLRQAVGVKSAKIMPPCY